MFDNLPSALLALFLAFCVLWLIWQALRRLRSFRRKTQEPYLQAQPAPRTSPHEATQPQVVTTISTIPDAADILALKAAIDNLARQVAALEKRLASGQFDLQSASASPSARTVEPRSELPAVTPDHRI